MLHTETVETGTLDLIKRLMADAELKDFFMVGGTALSLLIGHRISVDIDLFTEKDFNAASLRQHLEQGYQMSDSKTIGNGVFGFIDNVKIDIIAHKYPLIMPLTNNRGHKNGIAGRHRRNETKCYCRQWEQAQGLC